MCCGVSLRVCGECALYVCVCVHTRVALCGGLCFHRGDRWVVGFCAAFPPVSGTAALRSAKVLFILGFVQQFVREFRFRISLRLRTVIVVPESTELSELKCSTNAKGKLQSGESFHRRAFIRNAMVHPRSNHCVHVAEVIYDSGKEHLSVCLSLRCPV